jgi:predicted ATP-binding protein involved in virulence
MKIESLHIENYRCFSNLDVNLDSQLTVLVGVNGSGKTAVLEALAYFLKLYANNMCNDHDARARLLPFSDLMIGCSYTELSFKVTDKAKHRNLEMENENEIADFGFSFLKNTAFKNHHLQLSKNDNKIRLLIENHSYYYNKGRPLPVVAFYSSQRILYSYNIQNAVYNDKKSAYENAFNPQIDFSSSLAWFTAKASQEALEALRLKDLTHAIPELSAVRKAVAQALGDYDEPYIDQTPPRLFIAPKGQSSPAFTIEQLSDGYRTMLALVMDLARRMAVANDHVIWPDGQTALHSPGVVLIDEIELHLHPSWQQTVLPRLTQIFPNAQFVVTTHSPQILTSVSARHIRILKDGNVYSLPGNEETEGAEAGRILEDVLGVSQRPLSNNFADDLRRYADMVYNGQWDSPEAEELRARLENHYGRSEPMLKELELHIENSKWERGL